MISHLSFTSYGMCLGNLTGFIRIKQSVVTDFVQHSRFMNPNSDGAKENKKTGT